ncbi:DUF302 domain-containing protein [Bradyrhizobium liaoningense]|uniref:DUF302 domain-containing protein n=1 Tax=Bradyrhizobium liaoningense TaxID=43992 RepID=UPI001BAC18D7|nr:DUF302 domain-containing protein [Bradyrhizobium liaoningense]MBR0907820.1 DUF302 domain-containing protein [Bradyrhizobium liaoningense]
MTRPLKALAGIDYLQIKQSAVAMKMESKFSFDDTVTNLTASLTAYGFTIFCVIDHQAAARSVGLAMPPATVVVYGNPEGGTPVMIAAPDFALELPLRALIREENGRAYVTLNSSASLEGKHGLPPGMAARFAPAERLIAYTISAIGEAR